MQSPFLVLFICNAIHNLPFSVVYFFFPPSCMPHLLSAGHVGWGKGVGPAKPSSTVCAVALFLPHQELRFIVYMLPIINVGAGVGLLT